MDKYIKFTVKIKRNTDLYDRVRSHLESLGYKFYNYNKNKMWWLYAGGRTGGNNTGWDQDDVGQPDPYYHGEIMHPIEVLKLTESDVVIRG